MEDKFEGNFLLDGVTESDARNYGTNVDESGNNQEISPLKCNLDADGIAATCAAYVGETASTVLVYGSKSCIFYPQVALTLAALAGITFASCTFFACRKGVQKINNKAAPVEKDNAEQQASSLFF